MRSDANAHTAAPLRVAAVAALIFALALLALTASTASAAAGHSVLRTFSTGANSNPRAIATDPAGDYYVAEYEGKRVEKFDPTGSPVAFTANAPYVEGNRIVGVPGAWFSELPNWFHVAIAVDGSGGPNSGDIYVTFEGEGQSRTFVYAASGAYLGRFGPTDGYFCGVALNPENGTVYLGQQFTGGPLRFPSPVAGEDFEAATPDGELKERGTNEPLWACAIAVDGSGAIYHGGGSPYVNDGIAKYDASQFGLKTATPSLEFEANGGGGASGLALDPVNGDLYADKGYQVIRWNAAGAQQGSPFGQLSDSQGIAVDGSHEISTTDAGGGIFVFGQSEVQLPTGTTEGSSNLAPTSADVAGKVDPDGAGAITACEFRFGEDTGYSSGAAPCSPAAPISSATAVSAHLSGLISGTTYHYRLFVSNANGTQMSTGDQTLTTPPATAEVATKPATEIEKDSARLNGSYSGDGSDVHYFFEWGPTNGYGHTTPASPADAGSGSGPQDVAPVQIGGLHAVTLYHYRLVVSAPAGVTRGADETLTTAVAVAKLTPEKPSNVTETSAELHASYQGDGATETHYYFEWGQTAEYGNLTPAPPGNAIPPSSGKVEVPGVTISGLQNEGATYHFRVVASNSAGTTYSPDETFRTAEAPVVSNLHTAHVTATSAELIGDINPRNDETTYQFEWGSTVAFGNTVPVPAGGAGSGDAPVTVSAQIEGLNAGTTYLFRLVATNQYGSTFSPTQSFGFYPPACPNSQVRQETRSNDMPDCRAYELVTPSFAQGTAIMASGGPTSGVATNPSRLAYSGTWGLFPAYTGEATASFSDMYVSTRTPTGWTQKYVGLKADEAMLSGGPPGAAEISPQFSSYQQLQRGTQATPDLSRVIDYDWGYPGQLVSFGIGSNAPYEWDTTTGEKLGRWPTNLAEVENGTKFVGMPQASADFSHFVFSSNLVFAEGGKETPDEVTCCSTPTPAIAWPKDYVYDNDTETGEVVLASRKSAAKGEAPFQGWALDISEDGSRILLTEDAHLRSFETETIQAPIDPGQEARVEVTGLDLRVDEKETIEIAPGRKLAYAGSTTDGKTIFLTSKEQLTSDDHDSSNDLFVWHEEEPNTLTRISIGDHGDAGDTDECAPVESWTSGCGVSVVGGKQGFGGNGWTDDYFASEGEAIYFESPEQLVGHLGNVGERNLYVYRNGSVHFVATLRPNADATRMQVNPDGAHMSLVTASNLTDYNSAGHQEMYVYTPGEHMVCASCRPDGEPPISDVAGSENGLFLTEDGRVFFATRDALVPRDTNEAEDIYEFTEGKAQLITSGIGMGVSGAILQSVNAPGLVSVSLNGLDVYFATPDNLVTQDHNGAQLKIYDARAGGGYPAEREEPKCVAADECHGPDSAPAPLPADRTSAPIGTAPKPATHKRKKKNGKKHKHKHKHKHPHQKRGVHRG